MPEDHASSRSDRSAAHPDEISDAGWWEILKRVWQASSEKSLWVAAAGVAFFAFYALIPMFAVLVLVYGLFVGTETVQGRMQELGGVLPEEAVEALYNQLIGTARDAGASFGWGLAGSVMMMIWSILFGMRALMAGLNHAYHERETRGFLALNGQALLLGCGGLVLVIGSVGLLTMDVSIPGLDAAGPFWSAAIPISRWLLLAAIMIVSLAHVLSHRPVSRGSEVAMGRLGCRGRRRPVDTGIAGVLALRPPCGELRDGLRRGGIRADRDDLALPGCLRGPHRSGSECRNGEADITGHDDRSRPSGRCPRRQGG